MYLVNTRPNICYAVNVLSQFMIQLRQTQWIEAKHVLRYLRGIIGYASSVDLSLQGYVDAYWAGSAVEWKSTSDFFFTLGSPMVSRCSKKQSSVALSTAKEEYIALSVAVREAMWLRKLLKDLFDHEMDPTIIHCDNRSCVNLSKNPMFHDRLKHIETKYHYIRDIVQRKVVHVQYLPTYEQIVDIFTKPLAKMKFEYFRERLGLVENSSLDKRECS
jgi:hypothetical protein